LKTHIAEVERKEREAEERAQVRKAESLLNLKMSMANGYAVAKLYKEKK
jgi:hypothetical protein